MQAVSLCTLQGLNTQYCNKMQAVSLCTLQGLNRDAYTGTLFLREGSNRTSLFKGAVHDPVMMTIRSKQPMYAVYVQKLVGRALLESFVCENPDDVTTLINKFKNELGLRRINVVHSVANHR